MNIHISKSGSLDDRLPDEELGQSNGWGKMETTIQYVDRAKIDDCKEDIDTLLVFAGLFSAVLSAFALVSLQDLQEDYAQISTDILERISAQVSSYTTTQGFMNSTVPPFRRAPFEPSHTAVVVNILWFASLILSLSSASFGILVKQWLREYLAGDFVSPQARLRIRHFRHPGMEIWKVFEIAAVLPLLLQISLGLFFYGLCLYTADTHKSVGWAAFVLVGGWLSFFVLTTIAPLFSDRCPYKTTFLKHAIMAIRRQALLGCAAIFFYFTGEETELPQTEDDVLTQETQDDRILLAVDRVLLDDNFLATTIWESCEQLRLRAERATAFVVQVLLHRIPALDLNLGDISISTMQERLLALPSSIRNRILLTFSRRCDELRNGLGKGAPDAEMPWISIAIKILAAMPPQSWTPEVKFILRTYVTQSQDADLVLSVLSCGPVNLEIFATGGTSVGTSLDYPPAERLPAIRASELLDSLSRSSSLNLFTGKELQSCVWSIAAWMNDFEVSQSLFETLLSTGSSPPLDWGNTTFVLLTAATKEVMSYSQRGMENTMVRGDIMASLEHALGHCSYLTPPSWENLQVSESFCEMVKDNKSLRAFWQSITAYFTRFEDDPRSLTFETSIFGVFGRLISMYLFYTDAYSESELEEAVSNLSSFMEELTYEITRGSPHLYVLRVYALKAFACGLSKHVLQNGVPDLSDPKTKIFLPELNGELAVARILAQYLDPVPLVTVNRGFLDASSELLPQAPSVLSDNPTSITFDTHSVMVAPVSGYVSRCAYVPIDI